MHEAPMTWTTIGKARPTQKLDDLKQKYEKLVVAVLQIKLQTNSPTEATWNQESKLKSPLVLHLLQEELPAYYVSPKFNLYNGTSDPTEHIYHFRQFMDLVDDWEGQLYQGFSFSLHGSSPTWFHQLLPYFINGFMQLCD